MDFPAEAIQTIIRVIREALAADNFLAALWANAGDLAEAIAAIVKWYVTPDAIGIAEGGQERALQAELSEVLLACPCPDGPCKAIKATAEMSAGFEPKGLIPWVLIIELLLKLLFSSKPQK